MNIFLVFLFFCFGTISAIDRSFKIDYENRLFLKDGKPFRYIAGNVFYHRIHPNQWNDRLSRIRAAGCNAVQVYIPWNYHEPFEGKFNFDGNANVTKFLLMAQSLNLSVLLRPGPYINAEWEFGGFPYWLLKKDGIQLRRYNDPYISAVKTFFTNLLPKITPLLYKNGGPILMLQVENEYGLTYICDKKYVEWLRDLIKSFVGNDTVLFSVDPAIGEQAMSCGTSDGVFATVDFGPTDANGVKYNFKLQQSIGKGGPAVDTEFYTGWFTVWGSETTNLHDDWSIMATMKTMWENNGSFVIYTFHGGSNFGFTNGATEPAPLITSYQFGGTGPLTESGNIRPLYRNISNWIGSLTDYDTKPQSTPFDFPSTNYGQVTLQSTTKDLISGLQPGIIDQRCRNSSDPISFEQLDQPYGFVLYSTILQQDGNLLNCSTARDHIFVFVNNDFHGMLLNHWYNSSNITINIGAKSGDFLNLLVENRGRVAYNPGLERKGLFPGILLDGNVLKNWKSCPIDLETNSQLLIPSKNLYPFSSSSTISPPLIWQGILRINDIKPRDTYFNPTGFSKGVLFVNGFNVGRYWSTIGPQVTLYVPSPILVSGNNNITVVELFGNYQGQVEFVDQEIYREVR